ncbi:helix-turn-helix transcriptional regulator [Calidifontibacter terrae]
MSRPSPAAKTERLLNLVICLLYTRQPLSKQQIRGAVPQYGETAGDEAFDRMFERDKDELRDLGIPLRAEAVDPMFDDETGYRIDRREYALPELSFEPDELAVLGLASRTWQQASLAGSAATALRKLEAADVERDEATLVGFEPRVRTAEPAFPAAKDAVVHRRQVTFRYRRPGQESLERQVQPWSVTNWHGRWYLTGFDLDRQAPRVFRLGRVDGPVRLVGRPGAYDIPADHEPLQMIAGSEREREPHPAVVRVRSGAGHALRHRARTLGEVDDVWAQLDIDFTDAEIFADQLAGYGPDVVVIHPPELREAVVRRLRAALARQEVRDGR